MQHQIVFLILSTVFLFRLSSAKNSSFVKPEDRCDITKKHRKNGVHDKIHPYKGGDYSDIFLPAPKQGQFQSLFSIPENQNERMPCYIEIEYFNIVNGTGKYVLNDTAILTDVLENNISSEETSKKGIWVTLHKKSLTTQSEAYILRSTSGKNYYNASLHF